MNTGLFVLLIGGLLIAATLVLFLPTRASRSNADTSADRHPTIIYRDDDRYWYGGFLYNNPDDPDVFVPKRYGIGWTVNFGHPRGKLVLIGTLLLPVVLALLGVLVPGFAHSTGCHPSGCNPFP